MTGESERTGGWRFPARMSKLTLEERRAVLDVLFFEGREFRPYLYRLAVLTALSTVIASLGLVSDSAAVVIGAMLIAPLMTPTMALAAALVMGWPLRQLRAFLLVAGASAAAIGIAWLLSALVPAPSSVVLLSGELQARTDAKVIDLLIATAAGAAAAYVTVRAKAVSALPGTAIAVALLPPLAATGILLQRGADHRASNAFLLFVTNLAAIVLAAAVVLVLTGFVPNVHATLRRDRRRLLVGLATTLLAVGGIVYPLERHSSGALARARTTDAVSQQVRAWLGQRALAVQRLDITNERVAGEQAVTLTVDLIGRVAPPPAASLADRIRGRLNRPVKVIVRWTKQQTEGASSGFSSVSK